LRQFRTIWCLALLFFGLYAPLDYWRYGAPEVWPLLWLRALILVTGTIAVLSLRIPWGVAHRDGIGALSLAIVSLCYAYMQLRRGSPGPSPGAVQLLVIGIYLFSPGRFRLVCANAIFCSAAVWLLALRENVSLPNWLEYSYLLPANFLSALALSQLNAMRRRVYRQGLALRLEAQSRRKAQSQLEEMHLRSIELLNNTLPADIAEQLSRNPDSRPARHYQQVTVLFADLVGFTTLAGALPARGLLRLLNQLFSRFDELAEEHRLEKIKTVGDAYMAVAGLEDSSGGHQARAATMALAQQRAIASLSRQLGVVLQLRIGIHSGSVVGGVIGHKRFAFDVWGETVNVASRLETAASPGRILVSGATRRACPPDLLFGPPRRLELRGCGRIDASTLYSRLPTN
jgi:class 3 adenylate cyclase